MRSYLKYYLLTLITGALLIFSGGVSGQTNKKICGNNSTPTYHQNIGNQLPPCPYTAPTSSEKTNLTDCKNITTLKYDDVEVQIVRSEMTVPWINENKPYDYFTLKVTIDDKISYHGGWYYCGFATRFLKLSENDFLNIIDKLPTQSEPNPEPTPPKTCEECASIVLDQTNTTGNQIKEQCANTLMSADDSCCSAIQAELDKVIDLQKVATFYNEAGQQSYEETVNNYLSNKINNNNFYYFGQCSNQKKEIKQLNCDDCFNKCINNNSSADLKCDCEIVLTTQENSCCKETSEYLQGKKGDTQLYNTNEVNTFIKKIILDKYGNRFHNNCTSHVLELDVITCEQCLNGSLNRESAYEACDKLFNTEDECSRETPDCATCIEILSVDNLNLTSAPVDFTLSNETIIQVDQTVLNACKEQVSTESCNDQVCNHVTELETTNSCRDKENCDLCLQNQFTSARATLKLNGNYQFDNSCALTCDDPCKVAQAQLDELVTKRSNPDYTTSITACNKELSEMIAPENSLTSCKLKCGNSTNSENIADPSSLGPCDDIINLNEIVKYNNADRFGQVPGNPFIDQSDEDRYDGIKILFEAYQADGSKHAYSSDSIYNNEGNSFFKKCQQLASTNWENMSSARTSGENLDKLWSLSWAVFIDKILNNNDDDSLKNRYLLCKEVEEKAKNTRNPLDETTSVTPEEFKTALETFFNSAKHNGVIEKLQEKADETKIDARKHLYAVRKCTALVHLTHRTEYDDVEVDDKKEKASGDGTITCKRHGALTQDYTPCDALITAYDISLVTEQALVMGQQVHFAGKQNEWQLEFQNDEDQVKAPIRLQIKTLTQQRDYIRLQTLGYTAKAATLGSWTASIPKMSKLLDECQENFWQDAGKTDYLFLMKIFKNGENSTTFDEVYTGKGIDVATAQTTCSNIVRHHNLGLIRNDVGKEQGAGQAIKATIKAVELGYTISILTDNIAKLDRMLKGIEDFDPKDLNYTMEDLIANECEINPSAPACGNITADNIDVGFLSQSITVQANGASGTGDYTLPDQEAIVGLHNTTGPDGTNGDKMSPIDFGKSGPGGFKGRFNRASVKSSKAGFGGGGGGGGAGRMAAASGGSRKGASAGKSRYKSQKYSYKGKSKTFAYGGGSGKKSSKNNRSNNLFGNLFNKKAAGKKDVINFRELASEGKIGKASGRNIFKMISDRYDFVESKSLLLEYEKSK